MTINDISVKFKKPHNVSIKFCLSQDIDIYEEYDCTEANFSDICQFMTEHKQNMEFRHSCKVEVFITIIEGDFRRQISWDYFINMMRMSIPG